MPLGSRPLQEPFTLTAWYLGQYPAAVARVGSKTLARDVPGGGPGCPVGP